jgi:hypothetical protein
MTRVCYINLHKLKKVKELTDMIYLIALAALLIAGWGAAAVIGTMAYFRGEQTKPIHQRNWNNASFEQIAQSVTGVETDYSVRVPAYALDAYSSNKL